MTTLAKNFVTLLLEWQAVDLDNVVQHAGEDSDDLTEVVPVEAGVSPMADKATCDGTWDQGYIVFVDNDGDIDRTPNSEAVLRSHAEIADGVTMIVAGDATYFSYSSTGLGRPNINGQTALSQVVMCDARGNLTASGGGSAARLFVVTPLGRAAIFRDKELIDEALKMMGKTCP